MRRFTVLATAIMACLVAASPAWAAVQVLADFEDQSGFDYYNPTNASVASADTPSGSSSFSMMLTIAEEDWAQFGEDEENPDLAEFYGGFDFSPAIDLSGWDFLNFYIKGSSTAASNGGFIDIQDATTGVGWNPPYDESGLPSEWTYISIPIGEGPDFDFGTAHDLTQSIKLEFGFNAEDLSTTVVFIDHVTVSNTEAEGMLAGGDGDGDGDCEDPFLAQSTAFPIEGESFSISVSGVDSGCIESVTWTKDGSEIVEGDACATISPAGATAGQTVNVDAYDGFGNVIDLSGGDAAFDVAFAEVGFATARPERAVRVDHITLSDTPANGMLGAGGGAYVLSACETGDIPPNLSDGAFLNETDSAGAGSSACIEIPTLDYSFFWIDDMDRDVSCCANYLNFYMKIDAGEEFDGWSYIGFGTNDWAEGGELSDGFTFPSAGGGWTYVSIPLSSFDQWGPPDYTVLSALGVEFGQNATEDYYSVSTDSNPGAFATGSAVFTLTADMAASDRFWTFIEMADESQISVEVPSTTTFLAAGGSCEGAKTLTGIGDSGATLEFAAVSEADEGTYCAMVTIDGSPVEVCTTVSNVLPSGTTLPVSGLIGLGVATLACGAMGAAALVRRKKK